MIIRICIVCAAILAVGGCNDPQTNRPEHLTEYSTADGTFTYLFADRKLFAGYLPDMLDNPVISGGDTTVIQKHGITCLVISDGTSYAVKNTQKVGDVYRCGNTIFNVVSCNNLSRCHVSLIHGRYYMHKFGSETFLEFLFYFDRCRGITSFINRGQSEQKFEFGRSVELRGYAGVLADSDSIACQQDRKRFEQIGTLGLR